MVPIKYKILYKSRAIITLNRHLLSAVWYVTSFFVKRFSQSPFTLYLFPFRRYAQYRRWCKLLSDYSKTESAKIAMRKINLSNILLWNL